jgi:NAD+ synthase
MALSNKFGPMLVTTGNKSEMSVGYATIYGDMNGGYNPLKDAYKTTVFAVSRWRNTRKPKIGLGPEGAVMPDRVIIKPPSAELRPDQKDRIRCRPTRCWTRSCSGWWSTNKAWSSWLPKGSTAMWWCGSSGCCMAEYKRRQAPPA